MVQWILLVFAIWPHQKTGFEASERNKDALHALIARKMTLDALHIICVATFLARASQNRIFLKQNTERRREERGERDKKNKEGERGEREKRRQQTAPLA